MVLLVVVLLMFSLLSKLLKLLVLRIDRVSDPMVRAVRRDVVSIVPLTLEDRSELET
jgi:hypothetical protein